MILYFNDGAQLGTISAFTQKIEEIIKSKQLLFTSDIKVYQHFNCLKIWGNINYYSGLPQKSSAFCLVDQISITANKNELLGKLSNIVTEGFIAKWIKPWYFMEFERNLNDFKQAISINEKFSEQKRQMKEKYEAAKEEYKEKRRNLKELYEEQVEAWKELKKEIEEENKKVLSDFKLVFEKADPAMKAFMNPPAPKEIPLKPEEPDYGPKPEEPEYPVSPAMKSYRDFGLESNEAWLFHRRYEIIHVLGLELIFFKKRDRILDVTQANILSSEIKEWTEEEFVQFVKEKDENFKSFDLAKQSIDNVPQKADLLKLLSSSITDSWVFSEELLGEVKRLPPLTPINEQRAASMLAGGLTGYEHILDINGQETIMKAALIEESKEREIVVNNQVVKETISSQVQVIGVYNTETYELDLY